MSGRKHLWSGNWEDEPFDEDEVLARPTPPRAPEPTPPPAPPKGPRKRTRSAWIVLGVAVLVAAAGAFALTTIGGSSHPRSAAVTSTPTTPAPRLAATTPTMTQPPAPSSPPISWLGMELVSVPPGGATVETVKLGSEGDRAGLSPGDVILEIDGTPVSGVGDIAKAISQKHAGDTVQLQISHGSALYKNAVTLGAPPHRYP